MCYVTIRSEEWHGIIPDPNLESKLDKLKESFKKSSANKINRLEKKKGTLIKKIESQKKKGDDASASEKALAKLNAEIIEENGGGSFEFESFIPVARMQTESEFEGKSCRQKSLSEALAAASKDKDESGGGDTKINFGMQGMVKQLRDEGVMATKIKKRANDKSIQDVLKLGSHLLK